MDAVFLFIFFKPGMCIVKTSMPRGMLLCSLHQAGALSMITVWNLIKKDAANLIQQANSDQKYTDWSEQEDFIWFVSFSLYFINI